MAVVGCRVLYWLHVDRTLGSFFTVRRGIFSVLNRVDRVAVTCTRTRNLRQSVECSRLLLMRCLSTTQGKMAEAPQKEFIRGYERIPELETAPENVKRIFRLSNANQLEHRKVANKEMKESFRGKEKEEQIAQLTLKINTSMKHCAESPKDKHNKVFLQWLIDQRKKKLKALKESRFEHYLKLIKKLDIPLLESPHSKWNKYKFRKFKLGVNVEKKRSFLERKMIK